MNAKRRRDDEDAVHETPPETLWQAIFSEMWRVPRPLRWILLMIVVIFVGGVALWATLTEKTKERIVAALVDKKEAGIASALSGTAPAPHSSTSAVDTMGGQAGQKSKVEKPELRRDVNIKAKFVPRFVTDRMITDCLTRGGSGKATDCAPPRKEVTLSGIKYDRGVIYTQSWPTTASATIPIPSGASYFSFTVGNYWTGDDCGGQLPMRLSVLVDGEPRWNGASASAVSQIIRLRADEKVIMLHGESGDNDGRCDDAVWTNVRFG